MDNELSKLGSLNAPEPDDRARDRAISMSLAAFDESAKKLRATQGSQSRQRQSSIVTQLWSLIMDRKLLAGSALATLLIVPAAAYIALDVAGSRPNATFEKKAGLQKPRPEEPVAAADKAKDESVQRARADADANAPSPVLAEEAETFADDQPLAGAARQSLPQAIGKLAAKRAPLEGVRPNTESAVTAEQAPTPSDGLVPDRVEPNRDRFSKDAINPVKSVATDPVSTFSIDVDTASYAYVRRSLMEGSLPNPDSVRVEEMINYFPYDWKAPDTKETPFRTAVTVMPTPWNAGTQLMHVAIRGYDVAIAEQRPANLVFLIDVSGSMNAPDKLPLLKSAFRLLVNSLRPQDTVSIVTYAGRSGVVLAPTPISDKATILSAIDGLNPGGGTAGADGIRTAYDLAEKAFRKEGVNRVFLATDGDFNIGPASDDALKRLIEEKRKSGIFLSILGFGSGNYNDSLMQVLAQNGNGTAAYIDTLAEAQKTLVEEATSSLFPIAKDVKIQVEFNPAKIAEYRLIGYETRALNREDFNNDKVDAGEIGSGHRVTAIYEITPKGSSAVLNDPLRYQKTDETPETKAGSEDELAFVKIRYKQPDQDKSVLYTLPVTERDVVADLEQAQQDVRFSVAVAAFGQKLKDVSALSDFSFEAIATIARAAKGEDRYGYRAEFVRLVELARGLGK